MRKNVVIVLLIVLAAGVQASAQAKLAVGSICLAYWEPNGYYFVATVVEESPEAKDSYRVIFADGDQAVVPAARVRPLDVGVGAKVWAKWSDGRFYSGTVARLTGWALFIEFDDGDKGWTSWAGIAVKYE
jgi:hypothetical protein